ncbi:MAG TPA: hypothetical protein VG293_00375 [Solirubrobacteraceae bacterium]|jgi:hypothetical protein|nr:hypothetical protein [Solirubrobacteraceae bacterium]
MAVLMLQPTVLSEVGLRHNNEDAAFASSRLVASNAAIMKMTA